MSDLPEIVLNVESEVIPAKTYEAQKDLMAHINPQAVKDLTAQLSAEIASEINAEIDNEVLNDLRNNIKQWEQEAYYKKKKKVQYARGIDEDWEVSKVD